MAEVEISFARAVQCALAVLAIGCAHGPPTAARERQAFEGCVARMQSAARTASGDPELARGRLHVFVEDVTFEQPVLEAPRLYAGFSRWPPPHDTTPWPDTRDWVSLYESAGAPTGLPLDRGHLYYLDAEQRPVDLRHAASAPKVARFTAGRRRRRGVGFLQAEQLSPAALERYVALFRPAIDDCLRLLAVAWGDR